MKKYFLKSKLFYIALLLLALFMLFYFFIFEKYSKQNYSLPIVPTSSQIDSTDSNANNPRYSDDVSLPEIWPTPDIEKMKKRGCVADGLLSGYNRTSKDVKVARDSKCYFFSRAIETWRSAPDFKKAQKIMSKIGRKDVFYGMFIAEAINKKEKYYSYAEERPFDFSKMCKKGSKNFWGEHTCKPSLAESEYRLYIRQITREAMNIGVQVFLFGQIYHQEKDLKGNAWVPQIVKEMRAYAKSKNMKIIIGAQTNDITDEKYLRVFDYIEGGVGLHPNGEVEEGPCFSRWNADEFCWALLWNKKFKNKANNVFVHLDWSGVKGDDMSTFALMDDNLRHQTLEFLHKKFTSQDVGFLMPIIAPLPKDNGGCYGPRKSFYSPSMKYGCKDLDVINEVLE